MFHGVLALLHRRFLFQQPGCQVGCRPGCQAGCHTRMSRHEKVTRKNVLCFSTITIVPRVKPQLFHSPEVRRFRNIIIGAKLELPVWIHFRHYFCWWCECSRLFIFLWMKHFNSRSLHVLLLAKKYWELNVWARGLRRLLFFEWVRVGISVFPSSSFF